MLAIYIKYIHLRFREWCRRVCLCYLYLHYVYYEFMFELYLGIYEQKPKPIIGVKCMVKVPLTILLAYTLEIIPFDKQLAPNEDK